LDFFSRVHHLPSLGIGVSTEYGAMRAPHSLDLFEARHHLPECASFLELGVEVAKGLDADAQKWIQNQWPTTYHFLDINLDDQADFDDHWLKQVKALTDYARPAWLCGDAGMWHFGPRAQGHMLLLPPILTQESAFALADGIIRLREETGLEVLPENPPGHVYLGDLHLLDFFALVCERADTGMLLDLAHLTIYQHQQGHELTTGLDQFPLDRVVELHLAGGTQHIKNGCEVIEDDHSPHILDETWTLFKACAPRLDHLKALVFECERNPLDACLTPMQDVYTKCLKYLGPHSSLWPIPPNSDVE
jgi:uncharacterized protein (UPF0276 family)